MYNRKKLLYFMVVALSLIHGTYILAENVGEVYNTEQQNQKQDGAGTSDLTSDELTNIKEQIKPDGSITDGLEESSEAVITVMKGAMSQGMVTNKATIESVANGMGSATRPLISFVLGFFPGWILIQSLLEFFGFIFKPAAILLGLDGNSREGSSGSSMSGSYTQNKKSFIKLLVSDEAIAIYKGSSSSGTNEGSMSGSSSTNNQSGNKLKQWISYKIKWVITCILVIIFICTPLGFNIICFLIACILNGASWAAGKLGI